MLHVLASMADPWHWHWVSHTPVLRQLYEVVSWTWGGAGQGGQASETYAAFSSSVPCLALISLLANWWRKHRLDVQCSVTGCRRRGHPVHGTPYRACHEHAPDIEHEPGEPVTVEHIARAHERR